MSAFVIRVVLTGDLPLPVFPYEQTFSKSVGMSQRCQTRKSPPYSITSSARISSAGGKVKPSAFAAFAFIDLRDEQNENE
jgi:hypothetical protein